MQEFDAQWADWLRAAETGEGFALPGGYGDGSASGSLAELSRANNAAGSSGAGGSKADVSAQLDQLLLEMQAFNKPAPAAAAAVEGVPDATADSLDGSGGSDFAIDPRNLGQAVASDSSSTPDDSGEGSA